MKTKKVPDLSMHVGELRKLCPFEHCVCADEISLTGDVDRLTALVAYGRAIASDNDNWMTYKAMKAAVAAEIAARPLVDKPAPADSMELLETAATPPFDPELVLAGLAEHLDLAPRAAAPNRAVGEPMLVLLVG